MTEKFKKKRDQLIDVIDIALDSVRKILPENFNESGRQQFIVAYQDDKELCKSVTTLSSLKQIENDIFVYFQEAKGELVEKFWTEMKEKGLDGSFPRKDKLAIIFKRGIIRNDFEYDFIIDVMVPYLQSGLINENEYAIINDLIKNYEKKWAHKNL